MIILSCFGMFSMIFWHKYLFRVLKIISMTVVAQQVFNMKMTGKTPRRSQEIFFTALIFTIVTGYSFLIQDSSTRTWCSLLKWGVSVSCGLISTGSRPSCRSWFSVLCCIFFLSGSSSGSTFSSTGSLRSLSWVLLLDITGSGILLRKGRGR